MYCVLKVMVVEATPSGHRPQGYAMKETFDLFLGTPEHVIMWLGTIEGFENAERWMQQTAKDAPGAYFLFSDTTVAKTDTSPKLKLQRVI
jgi:hypothetical protein